jgi:hypothetical protein
MIRAVQPPSIRCHSRPAAISHGTAGESERSPHQGRSTRTTHAPAQWPVDTDYTYAESLVLPTMKPAQFVEDARWQCISVRLQTALSHDRLAARRTSIAANSRCSPVSDADFTGARSSRRWVRVPRESTQLSRSNRSSLESETQCNVHASSIWPLRSRTICLALDRPTRGISPCG